ncbi:hypothetical protein HMPREF3170_03650 [Corynebacterium sp. HMSC08D02]|uniref:hypothetical protein n=1 Tax=Corynebacterium sp. HMSC08D02 TaxID=1581138 RepID=UPI0008A1632C|nr:hypothetical protein [Corynebacterium sp. HMSC08D02]OFT30616.1 hypothetical protein HMPREF3170_03650 [Corynebacterium sp. HMSC08D02]
MTTPADERVDPHWVARRNFQAEVAELAAFYFGRIPVRWQAYLEDMLAADPDEPVVSPVLFPRGSVEVRAALWGFALASVIFSVGAAIAFEVL